MVCQRLVIVRNTYTMLRTEDIDKRIFEIALIDSTAKGHQADLNPGISRHEEEEKL